MSATIDIAARRAEFVNAFGAGGNIHLVRAPGRVNLIGEHTDYNDGFVLPMAIELHLIVACRGRGDGKVHITSSAFAGEFIEFSVQDKIERGEPKWSNYARGMAAELIAAGIPVVGMDAMITNTLPTGSGLASSAATLVGVGQALLAIAGLTMEPARLALIAQRAEHQFALVPSGIMDQSIVAGAQRGSAMLLDCRDLSRQFIPIDSKDIAVVIANTMVKHDNSAGQYAQRRRECETGVAHFQRTNPAIKALRDVSMTQLQVAKNTLDDVIFRRCRHVISENSRTLDFAAQLEKKNYETIGQDMLASHRSLRDNYEVSSPELDFLVERAMQTEGVYGARMTGGGFGGCIVALAQPRAVQTLCESLRDSYAKEFGRAPDVFATAAMDGVSVVE